ncbi:RNA methyltransferase [Sphingomonas sp. Leaf357]|uniref:RsmB/NOP family class I SAM-dependent RNA methyltransferase n=1 Tax=Sphingomonas sp. Leaf357 TaxID=1736350 RepID=UPI000701804C|nr:RsmB/NOP family class I SAM-dependent RNA methyltransferase [Sphingomonas sp. Leaf357]KQS04883.1 RNA methyltransferase [Sphingomonas sp. Leaf357]
MTPSARIQAAIDLLDAIVAAARDSGAAADTIIAKYFAQRRYAGSKDRRAVRELVYAAIRMLGERPASGRAAMLALAAGDAELSALFDGSTHAPAAIGETEVAAKPGVAPEWIVAKLLASGIGADELPALIDRAPLDVRINRLKPAPAPIEGAEPIPGLADAWRLPSGTNVETLEAFKDGAVEVQDAGSQIVTLAAEASGGQRIVDLCAGAGGKTLALAAAMGDAGALLAADTDRARLSRLTPRAERAGATMIETRLLDPGQEAEILSDWADSADCVLIDAPCSGTGTWRRNPEARWRLTPERIARLAKTQEHVLEVGAGLVKPDGTLVYIVCSLLDEEGAGQVAAFLAAHPGWTSDTPDLPAGRAHGPGVRLTPAHDDTDGFFVARLRRAC